MKEGFGGDAPNEKMSEQDPKSLSACRAFQNPGLLSICQRHALCKMLNFLKFLKTLKILSLTENRNERRIECNPLSPGQNTKQAIPGESRTLGLCRLAILSFLFLHS